MAASESIRATPALRSFHRWRGRDLHPLEEARMYFQGEGPVHDTLRRLAERLRQAGFPHIFMGATAVNAHGYERTTRDVDVCMRREDLERFKRELVGNEYEPVAGRGRRFLDPQTRVTFDVLIAGEIAGRSDKQQDVRFPDPSEAEIREALPVVTLARLVELKLVTWRLKDWADVIELIRANRLEQSFGERLHPVARRAYLECFDQMQEEDRYNAIHEPWEEPG